MTMKGGVPRPRGGCKPYGVQPQAKDVLATAAVVAAAATAVVVTAAAENQDN